MRSERGAITAFVAIFMFALLLVAGLVVDGGYILGARRTAFNEASAAARAGAQAVSDASLRNGAAPVALDGTVATERVNTYLAKSNHQGTTQVNGDTVTVDVQFSQSLSLLSLVGIGPVTVHGHGEARSIRGIQVGDD